MLGMQGARRLMKKLLTLLISLCFVSIVSARPTTFIGHAGGYGVGACATNQQSETGSVDGSYGIGKSATRQWVATEFVANGNYTVCAVDLYLAAIGSPTFNITAYIYSHDAVESDPDAQIGTGSDSIDSSTLGGTDTAVKFENMDATLVSGTTYWLVTYCDGADISNYVNWSYDLSGAVELMKYDDDGSGTWILIGDTTTFRYVIYSQ